MPYLFLIKSFLDEHRYDFYSLLLIVIIIILLLLRFNLFPNFLDIYYHLASASGFNKAGGYTTHAFWEYAPEGRINLYPPFFHFALLGFIKLGFPLIFIARMMDVVIFPFFLFVLWFIVQSLYNRQSAFFSLLLAASMYSLYLCSSNFIPATLSLIFGLLAWWGVEKGRCLFAIIFFSLSFYTHVLIPWIFLAAFISYGILDKRHIFLKVCVMSVLLSSPFIFYLLKNIRFYQLSLNNEQFLLEINICLLLSIGSLGKVLFVRGKYLFPAFFAVFSLLVGIFYPYRSFSGQGLLGFIILSGLGAVEIINFWPKLKHLYLILILFMIVISPSLLLLDKKIEFLAYNSTYINLLWPDHNVKRSNDKGLYSAHMQEIVKIVEDNSDPNDIIYTNLPLAGTIISSMSQRADSRGMLQEVKPKIVSDPIRSSKLIVWFKEKETLEEMAQVMKTHSLKLIDETPMAYIYSHPSEHSNIRVEKATIPNRWICILFVFLSGLLLLDILLFKRGLH